MTDAMEAVAVESDQESLAVAPDLRSRTRAKQQERPKTQPPYAVILHNDHVNGFDHVIRSLRKVFHYGRVKAFKLTMQAHYSGRTVVWSGMREHAELKADQLKSCGPDPVMVARGATALSVSTEPLPG